MGKPGAYLVEGRKSHFERSVEKTIHDFDEFAIPLSERDQRVQASRCMYCGVAFCQAGVSFGRARTSGCPLHNLIPEWNDLLWRGLWEDAYARLALTNPFPEFTGRVCPALCEAACNLGLNEEATTIRDNERAISDHAWESGFVKPLPKPGNGAQKVAVVGSGPSGLAAAWELTRLGFKVTVLEKSSRAGGLLMYGIPNMKLPKEIVERRLDLMRESGIDIECGVDATRKSNAHKLLSSFDAVVIAAGAGDARGLAVPGADLLGVHFAVDYLTAQTKALLDGTETTISAEGKDVIVIGGGDTGTDCVATALRQGAKSVHQLEFLPAPPNERAEGNEWPEWPNVKKTDYGQLEAIARQGADPRSWATDTLEVLGENGKVRGLRVVSLDWSQGKPMRKENTECELPCQMVLLAMGFLGPQKKVFDALGVAVQDGPRVRPALVEGHEVERLSDHVGKARVFVTGDARSGSSVVVSALSDGLSCAHEVAQKLIA